jgi:hypothetical protein
MLISIKTNAIVKGTNIEIPLISKILFWHFFNAIFLPISIMNTKQTKIRA